MRKIWATTATTQAIIAHLIERVEQSYGKCKCKLYHSENHTTILVSKLSEATQFVLSCFVVRRDNEANSTVIKFAFILLLHEKRLFPKM